MEFPKYTKIRFGFKETKTEIFPILEGIKQDGSTEVIFLSTKTLNDPKIQDQIQIIIAILTQVNQLLDSQGIENIMNVTNLSPLKEIIIPCNCEVRKMLEKEPDIYSDKDVKKKSQKIIPSHSVLTDDHSD